MTSRCFLKVYFVFWLEWLDSSTLSSNFFAILSTVATVLVRLTYDFPNWVIEMFKLYLYFQLNFSVFPFLYGI